MIKNLRRSVATGGQIKIGGKKEQRATRDGQGTWAPPRKDDHFTITKTIREGGDPNANLIVNTEIMTALVQQGWADDDGKIRRLPIALLRDDIEEVFPTAYVAYAGKSLACRGDGETATRNINPSTGEQYPEPIQVECPCERLQPDANGVRRCKFNGILHCALRLPGHAVIGSVYRWRTTSEISCQQMVTHLGDILDAAGTLRGLPLVLVLRPQQVSPQGKPTTVYVCHVDLCEDLVIAQRQALEAANMRKQLAGDLFAAREEKYTATLQLPGAEDPDELPEVVAEYYPDEILGTTPAGAEVVSRPPHAAPIADPLAGLMPEAPPYDPATDNVHTLRQPEAPAKPEAPPEVTPPATRTRRTKCKQCGELFEPGIVVKGQCVDCRTPKPEPVAQDTAPEIGAGPPLTPYQRIAAAYRAAVKRGVVGDAITGAMGSEWPGFASREPDDWSDAEADIAEEMIGAL